VTRAVCWIFAGCHLPPLCIGMEYAKTGNLQVSDQFLTHTLSICALDPLVFNEIGVLRYLQVLRCRLTVRSVALTWGS
jgi:anaphase-promoting complex subunit 6